jgi:glycosyltransferase involved in cell wall biosynthesis
MDNMTERGLYQDLVNELSKENNVFVVFPSERRLNQPTELKRLNQNLTLLKVKTGNVTKTNFIEKGISTLRIENQFLYAIREQLKGVYFDKVIYSTPPITFGKIIEYFKKTQNSSTYLMLKDIFPQNAVDLGILKKNGIIWRYFNWKEKKLYQLSDRIGCMSLGNINYIVQHNPSIDVRKIEVFPNAILPIERIITKKKNEEFLKKHHIPKDFVLFIYGGNLGKPQGISFLIEVLKEFHKIKNGYLLIVGSGTEYEKIKIFIETNQIKQVGLLNSLPKNEYDQLLETADVGLIFLDHRFTIPNFPSRLTAYLEFSLPVLAATDKNTDIKDVLIEANCGLWTESIDASKFIENARILAENTELRKQMGINGRAYLEENYDIRKTISKITTDFN